MEGGSASSIERRAVTALVAGLAIFGVAATAAALVALGGAGPVPRQQGLLLTLAFTVTCPWQLQLPSGAAWRPAVALAAASMFLLPPVLLPLVVLPGLVVVTARSRGRWWSYPLTWGHVGASLYAGGLMYHLLAPPGPLQLPAGLPAILVALACHYVVNRALSAAIVAYRKRRRLGEQLRAVIHDTHWGYLGIYLIAPTAAFLCADQGLWGLGLAAALLAALYKTALYYTDVRVWQQTALTDGLTGAGNRVAWEAFATSPRRRMRSATLAMVDLDGFKTVNDEYGHATGDEVLRDLAEGLRNGIRDMRLFRYGGDEFVLFVEHEAGAAGDTRRRLDQALDDLNRRWSLRGYRVRASCGTATTPADGDGLSQLLQLADSRMYAEKERRHPRAVAGRR